MSVKTLKILISGNVKGNYSKFFQRITNVNTKAGPFDLILCVGDFFGDCLKTYEEFINGSIHVPDVPTYVLGPIPKTFLQFYPNIQNFDQGCELIDGITFLGRAGVLTTSLGLHIAYLNGSYQESTDKNNDECLKNFTEKEFESLVMSCQSSSNVVDILLTTEWPKYIFNYVSMDDECMKTKIDESSSLKISQLCHIIRPRYHFVGGLDFFYERLPFRNHRVLNEPVRNVTRFISMADVDNGKKMKWIYAFNIVPGRYLSPKEITSQPDNVTENPFRSLLEEKHEQDLLEQNQLNPFRYNIDKEENEKKLKRNYGNKRPYECKQPGTTPRKEMKIDLQNCWFCLASPNVDKSLIVSIGEHAYLALAKGRLTDEHMIILPIEHIRSTVEIQNDELRKEIKKFKNALTDFYEKCSMIPVFFERNFKSAHFQIQVIGLPKTKISSFRQAADEVFQKFECHEISLKDEIEDVIPPGIPYFYLECYNHYKFFVRINAKREFFPIQIGRVLMAHKLLLNCPQWIDWQYCALEQQNSNQTEMTQKIRQSFKPFDFTI